VSCRTVGYAAWVTWPAFAGFAAGFVLWGLGGTLVSGAAEALLYDGLAAAGAEEHFAWVQGGITAAELVGQVPAAVAATVLFGIGGYELVAWVSVGTCLAAAAVASRLPEPPPAGGEEDDGELGYLATLRSGFGEALTRPVVRTVVLAAALLGGVDAIEEYDGLLAADWGVATAAVPVALLVITVAGAAGALPGGRAARLPVPALTGLLAAGVLALGLAAVLARPVGIVAVAVFYGVYRAVLLVVEARLQAAITGPARATVTSVAGLGVDIAGITLYGVWALGGLPLVVALLAVLTAALPLLLRQARATAGR
jgi:hypothetical protein